ncbi:MAG: hypothetical protein ACREBZ_04320, partial [Thermoplasmata archaeon]
KNPIAQVNELLCKVLAWNITVLVHESFERGIARPGETPSEIHAAPATDEESTGRIVSEGRGTPNCTSAYRAPGNN